MDKDLAALLLSGFIKKDKYIIELFTRTQHARPNDRRDQRSLSVKNAMVRFAVVFGILGLRAKWLNR